MEEYTIGFPPEMNNEKYRKSLKEELKKGKEEQKEFFISLPLEGKFQEKKKDSEMTH